MRIERFLVKINRRIIFFIQIFRFKKINFQKNPLLIIIFDHCFVFKQINKQKNRTQKKNKFHDFAEISKNLARYRFENNFIKPSK